MPACPTVQPLDRVFAVLDTLQADRDHLDRNWSIGEQAGRLLYLLTQISGAKNVLEVGTSIGYSGLWLAAGLLQTNGRLHTLDASAQRQAEALQHFEQAGIGHLVTCHCGDALALIEQLKTQGQAFDLVFIDAAKKEYWAYIQALLPAIPAGGLIVADNTYSHSDQLGDFLAGMADLDRHTLDTSLIDHAPGCHGLLIARKR
ncbi:MAG: class I SAM-dependent methyltransferase [Cyanobacteria bacterium HKST-UBA04]|nr:class I SAM-dependent methyltransferase [Cyanobacteria bacterium HKST-UBA04]